MSSEEESIPSPSCFFSLELTTTIYNKGRCVLCLALAFDLDFTLPVMLPEMFPLVDDFFQHSVQAA